ncbi:hypothetical protein PsorP6_005240 [Peronosclerospora sorghi]|uniref:Uncharacterized protein n=1 Tax=Peronosclerospora sorghi TaxID=230839 RepID=A0ACC0W7H6_9STRA|nr:hypothetical protein PsorP6_005240 [Peronosclerospora sorghi]
MGMHAPGVSQTTFVSTSHLCLFGHCNFKVFSTNGVFRTERKYFDRLYDFALEDEELFIQELCAEPSENHEDATIMFDRLGSLRPIFPTQLRKLYSHWYWVEHDCVLFRPKRCFTVPFSDHKRPYDEITSCLSDYNWLIKKEKMLVDVFSVLAKLENIQFLYALRSPEEVLKIELLVSS